MGKRFKKKRPRYVLFERMNWDAQFYSDLMSGEGFIISEPSEITIDGQKRKSLYGPQSPLYGTTYEDDQSFIERYRCLCGDFRGRLFENEICPHCGKPVEYRGSDINVTGWLTLGANKIISPYYYQILQETIGKNVFRDIINAKYIVDTDGNRRRAEPEEIEYEPLSPYSGMGVEQFIENFEEVIYYFKNKKKNKMKRFDKLLNEKRKVFVSHIPIPSTLIRPQSVTSDTFYYETIDKLINTSFSLSESLKESLEVEKEFIIQRLQDKINKMWEIYFSKLHGKEGHIRGELLGGSLNFTARNVIVPDPTLHDNEIDLSYQTGLELFKYKIIYHLMRTNDISLSKAFAIWKKASNFDKVVYDQMMYIIENGDIRVLINRNPTLNYYSMLLMRIRKIKPSDTDYSMSVPLSILPGLNADFDGDILNIIGLLDKSLVYMFRKFDPITRMIISRDSGLLNDYFSIVKGQLIDLNFFCIMGAMENDEPQTYPVKDNDTGEIIYVIKEKVSEYESGIVDVDIA